MEKVESYITKLKKNIAEKPWEFSVNQMLFLIEALNEEKNEYAEGTNPKNEPSFLHAYANFATPSSDCIKFEEKNGNKHITLNQSSLVGTHGTLPQRYTEKILQQSKEKNHALTNFLDIIHHRLFSLRFKAEKKNNATLIRGKTRSPTLQITDAIAGMRLSNNVEWQKIFSPFAHFLWQKFNNQNGLASILGALFSHKIRIEQFVGAWIEISKENQTYLNKDKLKEKSLGKKAFCLQQGINIVLEIEELSEYLNILPNTKNFETVKNISRYYINPVYNFSVQLNLNEKQKPRCILKNSTLISRNAWLGSRHSNNYGCKIATYLIKAQKNPSGTNKNPLSFMS